jgi:hypothetical protein
MRHLLLVEVGKVYLGGHEEQRMAMEHGYGGQAEFFVAKSNQNLTILAATLSKLVFHPLAIIVEQIPTAA